MSKIGGKAGYLPDISGRFNLWSGYALKCVDINNYAGAIGALDNMNALLDEEHRVTVSTEIYNNKITKETTIACKHCTMMEEVTIHKGEDDERKEPVEVPTKIRFKDIKIVSLISSLLESVLSNQSSYKVWFCPECKGENMLSSSNIVEDEFESPIYHRVVPKFDIAFDGISERLGFKERFRSYFNQYSQEIENAMMEYRLDYIALHGEDMENTGFLDKGDSD